MRGNRAAISKVGAKPAGFCMHRHFHGPSAGCRNSSKNLALACCMRWAASVSLTAAAMRWRTATVSPWRRTGGLEGQQGLQRGLIASVVGLLTTFLVDFDIGLGAGAMVVQIGIQVRAVELLDGLGVFSLDVAVAHVLADDGAIFGFH